MQSVVYTYIPLVSLIFLLGLEVAYMRGAAATRDAPLPVRQRTFSMSFGTIALVGAAGVAVVVDAGSGIEAGAKLLLLLAFPALLLLTRFFRAGEWAVLRRLIPGRA